MFRFPRKFLIQIPKPLDNSPPRHANVRPSIVSQATQSLKMCLKTKEKGGGGGGGTKQISPQICNRNYKNKALPKCQGVTRVSSSHLYSS